MELPDLLVARYERDFGKGSWEELERGVRSRYPEVFAILDHCDAQEQWEIWQAVNNKKWWQFWK